MADAVAVAGSVEMPVNLLPALHSADTGAAAASTTAPCSSATSSGSRVSLYPVLLLLGHGRATKLMVMVSFADVRKEDGSSSFRVGRAVMPKLFLEDVSAEVLDRGGGAAGIERRDGRYDIWAQGHGNHERLAAWLAPWRLLSSGGKVLGEEEKAAENIYIKCC
uniref:Glycerol-3-phosphate acyltransferase RAM2/GPAT1-8 HAD-like domain-containing protein n=1 Tax=Oryza glumipatula TaxID=40148 RepID=A0A0D9Y878_9ORYZ